MNMNDLYQYFGDDIAASATGDLQPVAGIERGQQRILRRLLTNPREVLPDGSVLPPDYIFHRNMGRGCRERSATRLIFRKSGR